MRGQRFIATCAAATFCLAALIPVEAEAQYAGNVLGGVIGGLVAGSIIAGSRPHRVYTYERHVRTRRVYARREAAPRRHDDDATGGAAVIDTSADPFAGSKQAAPIPVAAKP